MYVTDKNVDKDVMNWHGIMGAVPKDINGSFSDSTSFLKFTLEKATWQQSRTVCLQRGDDGRIGIKINVCQVRKYHRL